MDEARWGVVFPGISMPVLMIGVNHEQERFVA